MKFSEKWLREWVNPSVSTQELAEQLTMAGLEVAAITPVAGSFSNVLVGKVLQVETHPNAERLHICQIQISQEQPALTIICGAKNVRPDLKVAVAIIGSVLPNNFKIKKAKLRGVESYGMICSSSELGLSNESAGIMELPNNAPIGIELSEYLELDDNIITIELTPNRSDCLSINGLARELATINKCKLKSPKFSSITSGCKDTFPISISAKSGCPRYVGRVIRDVNQSAQTPLWITEKLRRSDIKTISAIVDITNYVMLELGQPLHAFDLAKLDTKINVRYAGTKEKLTLLDGQELQLTQQTLVIADQSKALAMAGVMGG
ncbi:MAG: phenylalanine--tRNA ligase subunit beta, partial [Gammaproteobacteria bacterium]|nr:phenylalanine--tRNA ligase subunit beta [Gammaproteobacteria bacterium]